MCPETARSSTPYDDLMVQGSKTPSDTSAPRILDLTDLQTKLEATSEERDQLLEELEQTQQEIHDIREERDRLREDLDHVKTKPEADAPPDSDEDADASTDDATMLKAELARLQEELDAITAERDSLLESSASQDAGEDGDRSADAEEVDRLQVLLNERTSELDRLKEDLQTTEEAVMEQEDEIAALEEKVKDLTASLETAQRNVSGDTIPMDAHQEELAALRADFEANLRLAEENAEERIAASQAEHAKALDDHKASLKAGHEKQVKRLTKQVDDLKERLAKAKQYQETVIRLAASEVADARRVTELIVTQGMSFKAAKKTVARERKGQEKSAELPRSARAIRRAMAEDELWRIPQEAAA